jgi:two-component system, LytTR family, response regulator
MTCIIVEDEPLAQERLKDYILQFQGLTLLTICDNAGDALTYLKNHSVDLIFLDIHMDGISGIQLLENYDITNQVIITTAYQDFAVKGFELNVKDYLMKPFTFERFAQAVEKVKTALAQSLPTESKPYFFVRTEYRLEKILFSELLYIEGMRDYRRIHLSGSPPIMTLQTFRDIEKEIPAVIACRVHKSYMVAVDKIDNIIKNELKIGDKLIPLSDTYKDSFFNILSSRK